MKNPKSVKGNFNDSDLHDINMLEKIKQGNDRAFAEMVKKHESRFYPQIIKMVKNPQDAQDILQEAFIKFYKNRDKYVPEYKFTTWMYALVHNCAIDFIRKKKQVNGNLPMDSLDAPKNTESGNLTLHDYLDAIKGSGKSFNVKSYESMLKIIQGELPEKEYEILNMFYLYDYKLKHISNALGMNINTVKVTLLRTRVKLQELARKQNWDLEMLFV
jgi:RNA polymerase sigma-70 factor (ECF subfamily)